MRLLGSCERFFRRKTWVLPSQHQEYEEPDVTAPFLADLQRASPTDVPAIRQLVRDAYAKWVPVMGREPMPMLADYDLAVREHEVDLAYLDGQLAALIELIVHPDHLFIENIAVAPGNQGLGLGRHMLAHAEVRARELGLSEMRLLTAQEMVGNAAFYQSVGYGIDRTEPFKGGFTVYMSKVLT
jgi:ribosomal protein S18 acetylase RimI-like enzyme